MRPRSFGFLLEVIMTVLGYPHDDPAFPLQHLTPAQHLLLRWGKTVPWSWSVWHDRRAADSEEVLFLVGLLDIMEEVGQYSLGVVDFDMDVPPRCYTFKIIRPSDPVA